MEKEVTQAIRKTKRDINNALGDDILRYITELVTNSDDSYKRIDSNSSEKNIILIELNEEKRKVGGLTMSVTDNAEGMSLDRLDKVFSVYGNDNANGTDSHTRGIFGQGASDVLRSSALEKRAAQIESIKDGKVSKLTYNIDNQLKSKIAFNEVNIPSNQLDDYRKRVHIPENGTRITFGIPSIVNMNKNIKKNLAEKISMYYPLRYLLNKPNLEVRFINGDENVIVKSEAYQFKDETRICNEIITFSFDEKKIECSLKLYRNDNKNKDGTNIIVRDENFVVYDNTMFDFANNAASSNISRELVINGLYDICYEHLNSDRPDAIIKDNRTGFEVKNDFYKTLNTAINPILGKIIRENEKNIPVVNLNKNKKINEALRQLNKYMHSELNDKISGGNLQGNEPPKEGIKFIRNNIFITKDKSYSLTMMINPEIVKTSDVIVINCNSKSISFSPNELSYSINEVVDGLVTKNVTIKGNNITNEAAILIAEFNLVKTACAINVIDSDIHYPENGLEFYPKEIALVEDVNHKVKLYFDKAIVPIGTKIKISCNNLVTVETMEVNESNLIKDNIGFIAIPVKGGSVGKSYKIEASACEIKSKAIITIIEQSSPYMRNGGMFSGIILEPSDGFFQSYFHLGTQQIVINPKNIINRTMLGDFKNCDPENPSFSADQLKYIYEIMATEAAYVLLAGKEVKNNVIDTSDVENAVEQIRNSIQKYKNNVYAQLVLNENDKDIQTSIL